VQTREGEPVGTPWRFCAFGGLDACITRFYDACVLRQWRWGRRDGRYGLNESHLRDIGERSRGIGSGLAQVSACFCLEDPCKDGIVEHRTPFEFRGRGHVG
jgi:hypothetical protein